MAARNGSIRVWKRIDPIDQVSHEMIIFDIDVFCSRGILFLEDGAPSMLDLMPRETDSKIVDEEVRVTHAMSEPQSNLSEFDHPPLIETVLGIEFPPIAGWGIVHFGLFWQTIRGDYPRWEVQPAIPPTSDATLENRGAVPSIILQLGSPPPLRCWFIDDSGTRLIQVQADRLIANWRRGGKAGDSAYPRYEQILSGLEKAWSCFETFLDSEQLPRPKPIRFELSYINHLVRGEEWQSLDELPLIFRGLRELDLSAGSKSPKELDFHAAYPSANEQDSLHVSIKNVFRLVDAREALQFALSIRGSSDTTSTIDPSAWLDRAHDQIVKAFTALTTDAMHQRWGRQR